jgi:hypothetical protein
MMSSFLVWLPALALYGLFLSWYLNWRGPLKPGEVSDLLARMEASGIAGTGRNGLDVMRAFLEKDDGRAFCMLNLVRLAPGDVPDPATGAMRPARQVLEGYTKMFMAALFARGGHPALVARKVGGYFDAWGVEPDPGWTIMGYMRYRSRRDLAHLVLDPRFAGAHDFKYAAMPNTFSFPTQPQVLALASPTVWVGLAVGLLAALAQIVWLLRLSPL